MFWRAYVDRREYVGTLDRPNRVLETYRSWRVDSRNANRYCGWGQVAGLFGDDARHLTQPFCEIDARRTGVSSSLFRTFARARDAAERAPGVPPAR